MNRILILAALIFLAYSTYAQTNELTYQGRLAVGGGAANTPHDFEFRLCASVAGDCTMNPPDGGLLGTLARPGVGVSSGIFTVKLDFDAAHFSGADRWLEIAVRPAGSGTYVPLAPRQPVTSAPYAIKSRNADTAVTAANAAQLGGVDSNQYVLTTDIRMTNARPPTPGSSNYVQNNPPSQQEASFNINGNGIVGNNFGIGVSNPTQRLHVNGSGLFTGNLMFQTPFFPGTYSGLSTEANNTLINFGINNGRAAPFDESRAGYWIRTDTRPGFEGIQFFRKAPLTSTETQLVTINDSGNLGIGISAPTDRLHVSGNGRFTGTLFGNGSGLTDLHANYITTGTLNEDRVGLAGMGFSGRISGLPSDGYPATSGLGYGGATGFTNHVTNENDVTVGSSSRTCIAGSFAVRLNPFSPVGTNNQRTVTLRINGIDGPSCTISGSNNSCQSFTEAPVVSGSRLSIEILTVDAGTQNDVGGASLLFGWECR